LGTSKGYIPPTDPKWKNTKRAVGDMNKKGYSPDSIGKAIGRFADAYKGTHLKSSNVSQVAGNVLGFISDIRAYGFEETVRRNGLIEFKDYKGIKLYNAILDYFTKGSNKIDDQIIRESLGNTFDKLDLDEFEKLDQLDGKEFLFTFLTEFIVRSFEECFAEKILQKLSNLERYDTIIQEVEKIVEGKIIVDDSVNNVMSIDFSSEEGSNYVGKVVDDAFESLKVMGVVTDESMD